jgi:hypothetical protein
MPSVEPLAWLFLAASAVPLSLLWRRRAAAIRRAMLKKAPVPADAMTCTFEGSFTEGDVTATISGTAVVVLRGQP